MSVSIVSPMAGQAGVGVAPFAGRLIAMSATPSFEIKELEYAANLRIPKHGHDLPFISITLRGHHEQTEGSRISTCAPGTILFHPSGEVHSDRFLNCAGTKLNIEITGSAVLDELGAHAPQPVRMRGEHAEALVQALRRELTTPDAISPLSLEGLTWELLATLLRAGGRARSGVPVWLVRAREVIAARFREALSLQDLAAEVGVHPVHLAQTYRRHAGCTIGTEIRRLRLECACEQIRRGQPLAEVALECGFADQASMSRAFRRCYGQPPGRFRREAGQTADPNLRQKH